MKGARSQETVTLVPYGAGKFGSLMLAMATKLETKHKDTRIPTSCGPMFSVPWIAWIAAPHPPVEANRGPFGHGMSWHQLRIHQRPELRSSEIGGSHHHSTWAHMAHHHQQQTVTNGPRRPRIWMDLVHVQLPQLPLLQLTVDGGS